VRYFDTVYVGFGDVAVPLKNIVKVKKIVVVVSCFIQEKTDLEEK